MIFFYCVKVAVLIFWARRGISDPVLHWPSRFTFYIVIHSYDSLQFLGIAPDVDNVFIFHAGTKRTESGNLVTCGERVLTIVA